MFWRAWESKFDNFLFSFKFGSSLLLSLFLFFSLSFFSVFITVDEIFKIEDPELDVEFKVEEVVAEVVKELEEEEGFIDGKHVSLKKTEKILTTESDIIFIATSSSPLEIKMRKMRTMKNQK